MSDQPGNPRPSSVAPSNMPPSGWLARQMYRAQHTWRVALFVAAIMVGLALVGIGLSTSSREIAPKYWLALVPIYGVLCTGVAWYRATAGESTFSVVIRQGFHWLCIAAAVGLDFSLRSAGEQSGTAAGLTALMLLALGCLLAGVHFEWLFSFVGILLFATLILVVKAEQYLWLVLIFGGIVLAGMLWLVRWMGRHYVAKSPTQ